MSFWKTLALGAAVLALLIAFMFRASFSPGQIVFSNDGPLGVISAQADNPIAGFSGFWQPLNWIGSQGPSSLPTLSQAVFLALGPIGFSKFYAPLAVFVLGLSAICLLWRLGFSSFTSILGGIAAAFSTDFFSYACWGLGSLTLCMAFSFFALGAVAAGRSWVWPMLAGLAVGMGIMEGFDSGAIMSLYIAAFVLFRTWVENSADVKRAAIFGVLRVGLVALFAALMAAQALSTLIGTQISGISGAQQQDAGKEERWDWATQWSLPKMETLRVFIPGLYGYRMDTPDGGAYWGSVGQQPGWEKHGQGFVRYSGAGFYVGILVTLLAAYGIVESFRKDSVLSVQQKSFVRFWSVAALVSLLFAFGRHAPFYKIVYSLPYFSTIRNPVKFMHPFSLSMVILFGYGLHAVLTRSALAKTTTASLNESVRAWWKSARAVDRKWVLGAAIFTALLALGMLIFSSSSRELTTHLTKVHFSAADAAQIVRFAIKELGLTFLLSALSVFAVVLFLSGRFREKHFRMGAALFAAILVADLVRANIPWVVHYDYRTKYASNPVIDFLRETPFEHRVTSKFNPFSNKYLVAAQDQMSQIFSALCNEWLQHQFQFYRIHSLDITQMPRIPELDKSFLESFQGDFPLFARLWQLTNTRYILGDVGILDFLNQRFDPGRGRFKILKRFDFAPKDPAAQATSLEDLTAQFSPEGRFAIFGFEGAVPRAALYSHWLQETNPSAMLQRLAAPSFDPLSTALLEKSPASLQASATSTNALYRVTIDSYKPTRIELTASPQQPSLLVLFDKYDPQWIVSIDGKDAELLRANYIFRGVLLEPGSHKVVFTFKTKVTGLYISLASIILGVLLCLYVAVRPEKQTASADSKG